MIKPIFIKYKTRKALNNRAEIKMADYKSSQKIAILASDQLDEAEVVNRIVTPLRNDEKETSILFFCHDAKKHLTKLPHFASGDIDLLGRVQKEELTFFLSQNYDFAICLDESQNYLIDYVFSQLKAKCRIGTAQLSRKKLFDMMVQGNGKSNLQSEVLKYLKMIKRDGQK